MLAPVKTDGFDVAVAQTAGFTSNGLSIVVSGDDPADVAMATDEIMAALAGRTDLLNLKTDLSKGTPEVQVTVDPNKAIGAGLTAAQVGGEVRGALVGQAAITIVPDPAPDPLPVCVQVDPSPGQERRDAERAAGRVGAPRPALERRHGRAGHRPGQHHPRGPVARGDDLGGDRQRTTPAPSPRTSRRRSTGWWPTGAIPAGVTVKLAGVTSQMNEAFGNLFVSMGVAILLVYV